MISEKLYELAFEYKKARLWKILWDEEVFAVKLSGGRIGYLSVVGARGEGCALALYIGEAGIGSFRAILEADRMFMLADDFQECLLMQDSLQCSFEKKDYLTLGEQEEAKQYARSHGVKISGKNAYPQFLRYKPYHCPWYLQTEQEQQDLCEALEAALEMARLLEEKKPSELGLQRVNAQTEEVPMLEWENGKYELKTVPIPPKKKQEWPMPKVMNDIAIANLKKIKKSGVWECGLVRCPEPVQDEGDEAPFYPLILLAVNQVTEQILPVAPVAHYEENPEELLNLFLDALLQSNACPKEILVRDQRSYDFVKAFCARLKVKVSKREALPALEGAEYAFFERFGMDGKEGMENAIQILNAILDLDPEDLKELPDELVAQLKIMVDQGVLPEETAERVNQIFQFDLPRSSKIRAFEPKESTLPSKVSYVISVSLMPGCYRHIKISGGSTLSELHLAIQEAFSFDDDHAYAFFLDNEKWSGQDCYYAEEISSGYRKASKFRMERVGLEKGQKFKYLFDFGDEWLFQCKVLRVLEEETTGAEVIRSVGDSPQQYPMYDEEDGWDGL